MPKDTILTERIGRVGLVTVNRPEARNALDKGAWEALSRAFRDFDGDVGVRAIVVTGAGEKAFVAGADLNALKARGAAETFLGETPGIVLGIEATGKPTIAMINGFCLGGGLELAMACDIRVASEDARLGQTEINVGILPGAGGTQRLSRLVGLGRAKEMVFTGKIISAQEAKEIGLVNQVFAKGRLREETFKLAEGIAEKSPLVIKAAKLVVNKGFDADLLSGLKLETLAQSFVFGTRDHLEGIEAFLEKRAPNFTGE
jgi:enoyl-CoA hydratase